jgi:two-component system OmpR family sensor kinase
VVSTANAIAEGDLGRRIDRPGRRTEVGRLALAFNTMIDRIEGAFGQRAETERRLRQFVADASHELRTPLTSIRGYAELFSHDAAARSPEDIEGAMARIEAETRRMGVMVEDLLLLARLDQEAPLERTRVDLTRIVRECVADAQVVEPNRDWTLDAEDGVHVMGDADRLRQVVSNLLANVRAHTPTMAAATVSLRSEGAGAVLRVSDSGPGIAPEATAHVFERFYRVDRARSRRRGGNGLGLAIVDAIVTAHRGTVTVRSEAGKGAEFLVRLPR